MQNQKTEKKEKVKNKQTDYKSDGEYGYDQDPIAPAMPGQKKESPFAPVESSKKPKKQKIDPNRDLARLAKKKGNKEGKKALKKEKGTGSPYDGYTYKDYKRDKKRAGTGNHPLNK